MKVISQANVCNACKWHMLNFLHGIAYAAAYRHYREKRVGHFYSIEKIKKSRETNWKSKKKDFKFGKSKVKNSKTLRRRRRWILSRVGTRRDAETFKSAVQIWFFTRKRNCWISLFYTQKVLFSLVYKWNIMQQSKNSISRANLDNNKPIEILEQYKIEK